MMWWFIGFYGEPKRTLRRESWRMLCFLRNESALPWLCSGDFNETLDGSEQIGGNDRHEWCMEGFWEALEYCGLRDLGYSGLPYTWDNRHEGSANIKVRLDQALANAAWLDLYDIAVIMHVQMTQSDRCDVLIKFQHAIRVDQWGSGSQPFQYENMWRRHESYFSTVCAAWDVGGSNLGDIMDKLGNVQRNLSSWEQTEFGSVRKELHKLNTRLDDERKKNLFVGPAQEEQQIMNRLAEILAREEIMEKHRARVDWLQAGDRNTSFFHAKTKQRTRTNKIVHLKRDDGSLCMDPSEFEMMAIRFYAGLFSAQERTTPNLVT
jgi:hypothetical protein